MQDTPQPTNTEREEFREFLSEVIATLHDVQPFINDFQADNFTDEQAGVFEDLTLTAANARLKSTVKMLTELRGYAANEWLHAYMERKRANAPRPRYRLLIDGLQNVAEVVDRDGRTLVSFHSLSQINRKEFCEQAELQCPQQSAYIIQFFQSSGINALQSYRREPSQL